MFDLMTSRVRHATCDDESIHLYSPQMVADAHGKKQTEEQRADQRGGLTSKYCRQLFIMSMLLVLNNFIRKRTITKSMDERSDLSNFSFYTVLDRHSRESVYFRQV